MFAAQNPKPVANEAADARDASEIMKLVRKLRWIGENEQADKLQETLRFGATHECVVAVDNETD